jgi:hypothetical protein
MCLLSICNHVFTKFMTQVISLKANFPEYRIKSIRMDNTAEFHLEPSMIIVWLKELKYNLLFHMYTHKIVW